MQFNINQNHTYVPVFSNAIDKDAYIQSLLVVIENLQRTIDVLTTQLEISNSSNAELKEAIKNLTEELRLARKNLYGSKSEKTKYLTLDGVELTQPSLFESILNDDELLANTEQDNDEEIKQDSDKGPKAKKQRNRKKHKDYFSEDLPVVRVDHKNDGEACPNCDSTLTPIGEGVYLKSIIKIIPRQVVREDHYLHSSECKCCKKDITKDNVIIRPTATPSIIPGSVCSPSFLTEVIYNKYAMYSPIYRQWKEFNKIGLSVSDTEINSWLIKVTLSYIKPLYEYLYKLLILKSVIHSDETSNKIINRSDGKKGSSKAYLWVLQSLIRDGNIITYFHSSLSRSAEVFEKLIADFQGIVISDAYIVYNDVDGIIFASCLAHIRRKFVDASSEQAKIGVAYCNQIFALERKLVHLEPEDRAKQRQLLIKPILDNFYYWMETTVPAGKSALAKAMNYALGVKEKQYVFIYDGRIPCSNNDCENAIRGSVIGRKNWLFSSSEDGALSNSIWLSLIETAKHANINSHKYIQLLLNELPQLTHQLTDDVLAEYLPWSDKIKELCKNS